MANADTLFKNRKMRTERLLPFGFAERGDGYTYSAPLVDGQFELIVALTREGRVSADVVDVLSKEPYVLHRVPGATGAFVGRVREELRSALAAIAEACFEPDVFGSEQARQVIGYVRETYRDELQFLWQRFPENAIFRRKDNARWYAALLVLQKRKLGLDEDGAVDIIDLRARPEDVETLVDHRKYFPDFHMNKKHWITIRLDGSVPLTEIFSRIDKSFVLAARR